MKAEIGDKLLRLYSKSNGHIILKTYIILNRIDNNNGLTSRYYLREIEPITNITHDERNPIPIRDFTDDGVESGRETTSDVFLLHGVKKEILKGYEIRLKANVIRNKNIYARN